MCTVRAAPADGRADVHSDAAPQVAAFDQTQSRWPGDEEGVLETGPVSPRSAPLTERVPWSLIGALVATHELGPLERQANPDVRHRTRK